MTQEEIDLMEQNAPEKHLRFKGADFYSPGTPVLVLGAGGIGSHVAFLLAKQGQKVTCMDFDFLEGHNIGGQLHPGHNIEMSKVESLQDTIKVLCNEVIEAINEKFQEGMPVLPYTFSCFDNMEARKNAFESWCELRVEDKLFIDGRMLADQGEVYAVKPGQEDAYRATLFHDSEVDEGPCTNRATSYCGFFTSALMVSAFNNYMSNLRHQIDLKSVPFKTRYVLSMGLVSVQEEPTYEPEPEKSELTV